MKCLLFLSLFLFISLSWCACMFIIYALNTIYFLFNEIVILVKAKQKVSIARYVLSLLSKMHTGLNSSSLQSLMVSWFCVKHSHRHSFALWVSWFILLQWHILYSSADSTVHHFTLWTMNFVLLIAKREFRSLAHTLPNTNTNTHAHIENTKHKICNAQNELMFYAVMLRHSITWFLN